MMNGGSSDQAHFIGSGAYGASCSNSYPQNHQQQPQQHHQMLNNCSSSSSSSSPNKQQKLTPEQMRQYLANKDKLDCVLEIYHPKVAQKSYGSEKRFFSPPPLVYLRGTGWLWRWKTAQMAPHPHSSPLLDIPSLFSSSGDSNSTNDRLPDKCLPFAYIAITGSREEKQLLKWEEDREKIGPDRCAIKALHISENDNNRRKYFTLSVHCSYHTEVSGFCQKLGMFESKRIKVISKPSKKKLANNKQSDAKNQGINIASGTEVALFSRVRSQTTNTRYLYVKDGKFVANSKLWGSFTIHLIADEEALDPGADDFEVRDGFINYGSIVKLVDSVSGLGLPMMRICKVEKHNGADVVVLNNNNSNRGGGGAEGAPADGSAASNAEQVSQLHKCGFQMLNNHRNDQMPPLFMCFSGENIVQDGVTDVKYLVPPDRRYPIRDGAQWTIISTDTIQYRFFEALRPLQTEVAPVPVVSSLEMHASDTSPPCAYVELVGHDFYANLQAWLGSTPVPTNFINKELLRFTMPPLDQLHREEGVDFVLSTRQHHGMDQKPLITNGGGGVLLEPVDQVLEFPVSLVRDDGVVYATQLHVVYSMPRGGEWKTGLPRAN